MPVKPMPFVMGSRVDSFSTAGTHLLDLYGPDQLYGLTWQNA